MGGGPIAWIDKVPEQDATGVVARQYDAARKRAGRVSQILQVQSLMPDALRSGIALYMDLMHKPGPLPRSIREMLAVVTSRQNGCHYWTESHAADLRAEVPDGEDELIEAIKTDYRETELDPKLRALLDYGLKLTRQPWAMTREDVEGLRALEWSDEEILHAAEIVSYFNYINRIADGLGVDLEPDMPPAPEGLGPLVP